MSVRTRRWLANLVAFTFVIAAWVVRRFPPASSHFYPRCPIFLWLHIYCPGCGGTRAMAALLHGRLNEALHWNAMVVVFFPMAAVFIAVTYWRAMKAAVFRWPTISNSLLTLSLMLIGIFTVARNLNGPAANWVAEHLSELPIASRIVASPLPEREIALKLPVEAPGANAR